MTMLELYNLKLNEYKEYGLRERPWKLLAMLLLSNKKEYEPLRNSQGEFYKKYKEKIDKEIKKVEADFNFSHDDIVKFIEETVVCEDYEDQKVWFVFAEGFEVLNWGLLYQQEKTAEEIYSQYFDSDDLKKHYDIEQKAIAKNIKITSLDELINKIIKCPRDFYVKICNALTPEERLFLINSLENKNCLNCTNTSCRVEYKEKLGLDENGNPQGSKCIGWNNEELIGKSKVLRITDINKLKY